MKWFAKFANKCAEIVHKRLGNDSGKMLLATSMIGISMSSAIQALAVLLNNKYTTSQKCFMVPQEIGEAFLSMISLIAITKPTQKVVAKLIKTGKILPKNLVSYMKTNKILENRGKPDFDFEASVNKIISKIEHSDKFIKSNEAEQKSLINTHKKILEDFETFKDSSSAIATTAAGIVTTCAVVPLLRNSIASKYQKKNIDYVNKKLELNTHQERPAFKANYTPQTSLKI